MMKKMIALSLVLILLLGLAGCGKAKNEDLSAPTAQPAAVQTAAPTAAPASEPTAAPTTEPEPENETLEIAVREFNKRGNVILDTSFAALQAVNIEPADIITVTVGAQCYDFPVGTSYSDVDSGAMMCRFDTEDDEVMLVINGGSFAETAEMAVKETIDEDPGYRWEIRTDTVTMTLKEKNGYRDEYTIRNLVRTNDRADYSALSDADFANCRAVAVSGIRPDTLYRGTTPLDPDIGRDTYAMAFLETHGIRSILNLADSTDEMTAFDAYSGSCYAACEIWNAEMNYDFTSAAFAAKVGDCVKFILAADGPYYIHCKEGKDRTGILCAVLECFFGASFPEVENDYMLTYINFYHVEQGSETYQTIFRTNLAKTLCAMFELSDPETADLQAEAEEYLLSAGLTAEELSALRAKLAPEAQ